jgi:putative transposase
MARATPRYQRGGSYKPTVEKGKKQQQVEQIFADHKRRYGSRRIVAELKEQGYKVGRDQVRTLMKLPGRRCDWFRVYSTAPAARPNHSCRARPTAHTGKATAGPPVRPNLLLNGSLPQAPNLIWQGRLCGE